MPRRADHLSDLMTIGLLSPVVIGARLQMLAMEASRPTVRGRREAARMTAEKPLALMEGAVAAHKAVFDRSLKFWSDTARAANALLLSAPAMSVRVASVPVRQRVRGNARRLTGR